MPKSARQITGRQASPPKDNSVTLDVIEVTQGDKICYMFNMKASDLFRLTQINRRSEDKQEGYQRALSPSRVRNIAKYITAGGIVPGAIIISLDSGLYDAKKKKLHLKENENIGWVIDGQHRLAGAYEASQTKMDLELAVVALLGATLEEQIELFITVNREARGVPASLYIDLLKDLPKRKTEREITEERIADIARRLNSDEESLFFQRIIFTRNAQAGEISLVNFARILRPHIGRQSGTLGLYAQPLQEGAINNYYKAISISFPKPFSEGIFFRTIGFGGVWRAFPLVFNLSSQRYKSFTVSALTKIFAQISDFDFMSWQQLGTGSGAEIQAGEDLIESLQEAFDDDDSSSTTLKL